MNDFAKLYFDEEVGQIVVMNTDTDKGEPAIFIYFQPKGLGVCNKAMIWKDDEAGRKMADEIFVEFTPLMAIQMVKNVLAQSPYKELVEAAAQEDGVELDDI